MPKSSFILFAIAFGCSKPASRLTTSVFSAPVSFGAVCVAVFIFVGMRVHASTALPGGPAQTQKTRGGGHGLSRNSSVGISQVAARN
jgi:hypothetical protein